MLFGYFNLMKLNCAIIGSTAKNIVAEIYHAPPHHGS